MISYFGGPEGAGKTALMTKYCRYHHLLKGQIWAFPGYEHKNLTGRVVSKLVLPEQVMGMVDDMTYIVLVIDEMTNFMNHHNWQSKLIDILVFGALAQRRKREFVVLATGPFFEQLPPDLRKMFHVSFNCKDKHWANHKIPRGEQIQFTETDLRGVLSGRPYTTLPPRIFRPKDYFRFYDTFSLVDPKYQNLKFEIKKDVIKMDSEGNIISKELFGPDSSGISAYIESQQGEDPLTTTLREFLKECESKGLDEFDSSWLYSMMGVSSQGDKNRIGSRISQLGWEYIKWKGVYRLANQPSEVGA